MNRSYSDYIDIIDKVENIEQVIITDNKIKKCCYYSLELIKLGIQYIKHININIDGKKEKRIRPSQLFLQLMKKRKKLLKKHQLLSLLVQCVKRC